MMFDYVAQNSMRNAAQAKTRNKACKVPMDKIPTELLQAWHEYDGCRRQPVGGWKTAAAVSGTDANSNVLQATTAAVKVAEAELAAEASRVFQASKHIQSQPAIATNVMSKSSSSRTWRHLVSSRSRLLQGESVEEAMFGPSADITAARHSVHQSPSLTRPSSSGAVEELRSLQRSHSAASGINRPSTSTQPLINSLLKSARLAALQQCPDGMKRPGGAVAQEGALGCIQRARNLVVWDIPASRLEAKTFAEEKAIVSCSPLVSPAFELLGEPCVLKFWPRGKPQFSAVSERARRTWATLGVFSLKPTVALHVRLFIGPPDKPWASAGPKRIYFDTLFHPEQLLEAQGTRPFEWQKLRDGLLSMGVEVLENVFDPNHPHARKGRA